MKVLTSKPFKDYINEKTKFKFKFIVFNMNFLGILNFNICLFFKMYSNVTNENMTLKLI